MEYKFLKNIRLPYVKIFNITWTLCVNGIPYVPGFSEIFSTFGGSLFNMGDFFRPPEWEKNNVFRTHSENIVFFEHLF